MSADDPAHAGRERGAPRDRPGEEGGRIDMRRASRQPLRCPVADSGVGMQPTAGPRNRPDDPARAAAARIRRRCRSSSAKWSRTACRRDLVSCAPVLARAGSVADAASHGADRRRRAAAARRARGPARERGRSSRWSRRRATAARRSSASRRSAGHLLSGRAHAGRSGHRRGPRDRPARAPRVRHRLRPVRRAGLRARRAGLPGEAGEPARLAETVQRVRERLSTAAPVAARSRCSRNSPSDSRETGRARCAGSAPPSARPYASSRSATSTI